ncbi:MAG: rhomboid family intramembrane serine protease [Verrucomicrobiota bacterium]|nr:rhomboid family intramembrane serine protease [Verrucomicrobiota bacterium]
MRLHRGKPSSLTRPWTQRQRFALLALIGANAGVFCAQLFMEAYQPGFVREFLALSDAGVRNAYGWQFLTAAFLQNGPWHFLANALALYLVGRDVESIIGQRNFVLLYLAGAIAGELGHLFFMPPTSVLFGGSGGVAAVLFAYATILPELELTSMLFFVLPVRLKAKHLAYASVAGLLLLLATSRSDVVTHSAALGGCLAGWLYAHLLGFGRPSILQRTLRQRRAAQERYHALSAGQFIAESIDPLLEKISREGLQSLTRHERRTLAQAREKLAEQTPRG